jgi:biotin transport system permease protein
MTIGVYIHGESVLHRAGPGAKLLALLVLGTLIIFVRNPVVLAAMLAAVLASYRLAGLPWASAWHQLRPALFVLAILFAVQWAYHGALEGGIVIARFAILILFAALVSLTTRVSDMLDTVMSAVRPLAYIGISPAKVGLTFALAIRFIPVIAEQFAEIREAQRARGLERSYRAIAIPLIVRTLKMATEIGDAIEARSFDPDDARKFSIRPAKRCTPAALQPDNQKETP